MAEAHIKHHDYHMVPPSPWPAVATIAVFFLALGGIYTMHDGTVWALAPGLLLTLYVMAMWFRDIRNEAEAGEHTRVVQIHHRYGVMLFIASEVMFFVAWFWAYFDPALFPNEIHQFERTEVLGGVWPPQGIATFDPWHLPLLNTLILLTSGTTVTWAHHAIVHGDRQGAKQALWITCALGVLFSLLQAFEYSHAAFSFSGHIYGATFFMATGFHGFHVIVGTIFLAVCLFRLYKGDLTPKQHFGFEAAAWYWHFVDVVWLFLFISIYVWGYGGPVAGGH
ncbi:cytochrome c oxidase subunit 3 [Terrihabitans sp. B22-R8]|uniref:cytochrome c oxidase subunit 3 n=1 Tax=Terrihabitans sp. B22-R8 TaxID=3425128 RepID=UPI00403D2830